MSKTRRLVSIAHSYVVTLNRRLAHEIVKAGRGSWEVTAVAPAYFHGSRDLRPVTLEKPDGESCRTVAVRAFLTRYVHLFFYGTRLRDLLRQGADLVHCWEEPYVVAGGQVAWWTPRKTPLVFWTAQNLPKRYPPPFGRIERYCLERCAGWMACGRSVVETLVPRGYDAKPHRVMPLGVDVDHFRPDPKARQTVYQALGWDQPGPPVVGYLGRFVPEKGIRFLLQVLEGLHTPWRALLVGAGPLEAVVRDWARPYGDRVRVCTDVRHDAVPRYLNAMDLLCAPSQTRPHWREQFGRMLTEAFACGLPVIGSDSGEIPHVLGEAGLLVGETDAARWGKTVAELLEDPCGRRELAARGLDRAHTVYAWPVIARQYLDFFEQILQGRPSGGPKREPGARPVSDVCSKRA
jgi:glycosyltransferase involved in cell wall biosynthesis